MELLCDPELHEAQAALAAGSSSVALARGASFESPRRAWHDLYVPFHNRGAAAAADKFRSADLGEDVQAANGLRGAQGDGGRAGLRRDWGPWRRATWRMFIVWPYLSGTCFSGAAVFLLGW
ncbi:hypothetical protein ColLi_13548 [Colletotrichum liriopes]|uniref:Uncharacterized protein n=1 Tax=Colletotrichum liriopes TaxID=708192 RepID=A0AA37H0F5_9PEZI|nr:hypothetical protein ColLi_13548 [Colletotrichum liriopes]